MARYKWDNVAVRMDRMRYCGRGTKVNAEEWKNDGDPR